MEKIIYFAASIRGGRQGVDLYQQIIDYLKNYGKVLTEHVGDKNLSSYGEKGLDNQTIHGRDLAWVLQADVIVAEVTTPSLGVGYEIGRALENKKKILCLFRNNNGSSLSAMIAGCPNIINAEYQTLLEAKEIINNFFKK